LFYLGASRRAGCTKVVPLVQLCLGWPTCKQSRGSIPREKITKTNKNDENRRKATKMGGYTNL
jgi:hypothetical protein